MKTNPIVSIIAGISCGLLLCVTPGSAQQLTPIRVLSSNGVRAVMEDLRAECERAVGHPLSIDFSSAASLKEKIEAGEAFDVAILTPAVIEDLTKQGKVAPSPHLNFARAGVGVGVRSGAAKPDISSPEALKRTLLSAKSVVFTGNGASRIAIDKAFERLGIADAMRPKTTLTPAGRAPVMVAEGKAELVLTLVSEILPVKGVQLVGPFPAEVQGYVSFTAGVGVNAKNPEAAKAVLQFLGKPSIAQTLAKHGMEPSK
jgi:molybdate transport system substrate-binding protein